MRVDFRNIDGRDWTILDADTREPVKDHDDIVWADDEAGEYAVLKRDDKGKFMVDHAKEEVVEEVRHGRIRFLLPAEIKTWR